MAVRRPSPPDLVIGGSGGNPLAAFKKQSFIAIVALFFGLVFAASALVDFAAVQRGHPERGTPPLWRSAVLHLQGATFFLVVGGYVLSTESNQPYYRSMALAALAVNLLSFVLRATYEIYFKDYHPARHYPSDASTSCDLGFTPGKECF